jgi:hypothetical protein
MGRCQIKVQSWADGREIVAYVIAVEDPTAVEANVCRIMG